MLIWAAVGKSFRWGLHDFEDDSDMCWTGRIVAAVIGIALIIGAILYEGRG